MKQVVKVIMAAVAAVALAVPAMAASGDVKLKVRDDGNTADVFTVDNTGTIVGAKAGFGTSTPKAPIHLNWPSSTGTLAPVGATLYSSATGFVATTQNNSFAADYVVADGSATAGYRASLRGVRSRGTLEVPAVPLENDLVLSIIGGIYMGAAGVYNSADINFTVDGTVDATHAPQRISFRTRTGGAGGYVERLTIKNDGKIIFGLGNGTTNGVPIYADNTAAASLTAGTVYRTPTGVLMIKY